MPPRLGSDRVGPEPCRSFENPDPDVVMEKQKPETDASLLLALRCSRASLLLSSLRQPTRPRSSATGNELLAAGLLRKELAAARYEAARHAVTSGAEVLLVLSLVSFLLLLGLLSVAAVAAA
ncbi:hypothetical protein ABZP36_028748 [Zizania latifolia]